MLIRSLSLLCAFTTLVVLASATSLHAEKKTSWGIYQILWENDDFEDSLEDQINELGADPKYVLFFRDMQPKEGFPTTTVKSVSNMEPSR